MFVLQRAARFLSEVNVLNVKTLQKKTKLDITIDTNTRDEVQLLFSTSGSLFYLRWMEEEDGTPEIVAYDATTLKPLKKYSTTPATTNELMISASGDRLYSLVQDENIMKIDIFETNNFSYVSSLDIKKFFTIGTEGGVGEFKNEKLVVDEVISRIPVLESFQYVYDIPTNKISTKIKKTIKGDYLLIPATNKIALNEEQYVGKFKSMRLETDYQSSGKIHIFDTTTGKEVALVKVNVAQN